MQENAANTDKSTAGLAIERRFTTEGVHPFDEIEWEIRDALIGDPASPAFEQTRRRVPQDLVAERDQHRRPEVLPRQARPAGAGELASSQMIGRVAGTITGWGARGRLLRDEADADAFEAELTSILVNQKAAFNSPGLVQRRLRGARRRARPASSSASTTRWSRSSTGTPRRG